MTRAGGPSPGREAGRRCPPVTVVVECKQARGDFLRDGARNQVRFRIPENPRP